MKLETERLIIRPISAEDKVQIFEYRSDAETNQYQGWVPVTVEDVESFINKTSRQINIPGTWFQFVIVEKVSQIIIGDLGVHFFDPENRQVELGITLHKNFQKLGYATEALIGIIDFLFNDLQKHRIIASIDPNNKSSIQLVERIGFRQEAHFVQSLYLNGKWVDDLIYALLSHEWK